MSACVNRKNREPSEVRQAPIFVKVYLGTGEDLNKSLTRTILSEVHER